MAVAAVSLLSACASSELATSQIESAAQKQASEANITPAQAIVNARAAIAKADSDGLPYFTPLHFTDAQQSLEKIEKLQKDKSNDDGVDKSLVIITEAFKTQELINNAYKVKATIEVTLVESLNHQKVLDDLGSKMAFPKAYNNIKDDFIDLFKLIEKNKVEEARKEQVDLLSDMVELEVDTLVKTYVTPASFILDKAEDNDADDYAEKTFEQAEVAIERAKEFIANSYRQRQEVKVIGNEAVIAAKRALNIGEQSKSMLELDEEEAELKALEVEALMAIIIQGISAEDLRGLTLREQAQKLAELARLQKNKIKELSNRLAAVETVSVGTPSN